MSFSQQTMKKYHFDEFRVLKSLGSQIDKVSFTDAGFDI